MFEWLQTGCENSRSPGKAAHTQAVTHGDGLDGAHAHSSIGAAGRLSGPGAGGCIRKRQDKGSPGRRLETSRLDVEKSGRFFPGKEKERFFGQLFLILSDLRGS